MATDSRAFQIIQISILLLLFVVAGLMFGVYRGVAPNEKAKAAIEAEVEVAAADMVDTELPELTPSPEAEPVPAQPVKRQAPAPKPVNRNSPAPTPAPRPVPVVNPAPAPEAPIVIPVNHPTTPPPAQTPIVTAPAPPPPPREVMLESGSVFHVRLASTLSSNRNLPGDSFQATLDAPLVVDGLVVASKGSLVEGRVVNVRRAGRVSGVAEMTIDINRLHTDDGQIVDISTDSFQGEGPRTQGKDARNIGVGAGLGALIGAIAGGGKGAAIGAGVGAGAGAGANAATRGEPLVLPQETRLTFRVKEPVKIVERT